MPAGCLSSASCCLTRESGRSARKISFHPVVKGRASRFEVRCMVDVRPEPVTDSGASFSRCRVWRYLLWRRLTQRKRQRAIAFVGLNPSTADETKNDPTVRRCIDFARRWNFDLFYMLNAYAFRATDPAEMKRAADPVGKETDKVLRAVASQCRLIVAAWGVHISDERERDVLSALNCSVRCLGRTKHGRPRHPLYLRKDTQHQLFWRPNR